MNPLVEYEATFTDGTSFSLSQTQAWNGSSATSRCNSTADSTARTSRTTSSTISSPSSILMDADKFEAFLSAILSYQRGVDVESMRRIDHADQSRKENE
ncbi:hypothetical protein [Parascardovia denticolens]|uniref:hypothetical protein n=1 Tax=Parascardovia denticolens TaxID=78258 RepID=UPI00248EEE2D|nr:hypothetical protein [Parascardovia denticolens]